ncbi:crossover junction endodeoxyribonuclease RuvC [Candidatus Uhrbacteria bacterium]|nr:crossover junction endodeoxyribonuclease RuvC [Candidatus Uhrbacteria bacterium]
MKKNSSDDTIIVGIDPGFGRLGYGAVLYEKKQARCLTYGCIATPVRTPLDERLFTIYTELLHIFKDIQPQRIAVEKIFFYTNKTTAIQVSHARGVILVAARSCAIPIIEITPLQVKQALTGYGRAEKQQIQYMTQKLLHLPVPPRPDDAADALAIALCAGTLLHIPV